MLIGAQGVLFCPSEQPDRPPVGQCSAVGYGVSLSPQSAVVTLTPIVRS
jgi:hypothetical protein